MLRELCVWCVAHHSNPRFNVNTSLAGVVVTMDSEPNVSNTISPGVRIPLSEILLRSNRIDTLEYTTKYDTLQIRISKTLYGIL